MTTKKAIKDLKAFELITYKGAVVALTYVCSTYLAGIDENGTYRHINMFEEEVEVYDGLPKEAHWRALFRTRGGGVHIGSDPEFLFEDDDGTLLPSYDVLPEQKKALSGGSRLLSGGHSVKVYNDGWQGEMSPAATHCISYHVDFIRDGLRQAQSELVERNKGARISVRSVLDVDLSRLEASPEHAKFGCTPSLNAYNDFGQDVPGQFVPFRMAGGHIHFSTTSNKHAPWESIVKFLDATIGVLSVAMFDGLDDPRRRVLYGRAGEYRTPPHGLEYRTLSNAWLIHPVFAHLTLGMARAAFCLALYRPEVTWVDDATVRRVINDCDAALARRVIADNEGVYKALVSVAADGPEDILKALYSIITTTGLGATLSDRHSIDRAWGLSADNWVYHSEGRNCSLAKADLKDGKLGLLTT